MSELKREILSGALMLIEGKWVQDQALVIEEQKIKAIIPSNMIKHHQPAKHTEFASDHYIAPGFIDMHVHGAKGKDVMDADKEALNTISKALAEEGVTGFLATTMTASEKMIDDVMSCIAKTMTSVEGASILGVHIEGPFIAKEKAGAQHVKYIQSPNINLIKQWQTLSKGAIKLLTIAPELPHAIECIKALRAMDVLVSVGHTNATFAETEAAIAAGATCATHLFNAMRGIHQRDPGATGALLLSDKITAEIIADGVHLHPAILHLALHTKGKDKLMLVTDAMRAKCMKDGEYELGGDVVSVQNGIARRPDGKLAGSTLTLIDAIKNMTTFTHCSLIDAINMASMIPAKLLKIHDHQGAIAVGYDANLVVLDKNLNVMRTLRDGHVIFEKNHLD